MMIKAAKEEYLKYLKEKGYAESTIITQRNFLRHFSSYYLGKKKEEIGNITKKELEEYVKQRYYHLNQKEKQNKAESRNNEIMIIKMFFRYLKRKEKIEKDISESISYIKIPKLQIPKDIMSKTELKRIFKEPDLQTKLGYRDRMCLELLYATGIRRSELINLDLGDINLKEKVILIRQGKGQKDRVVPINESAKEYVKNYVAEIRPKLAGKSKNKAVILSDHGKRLHGANLEIRLKEYVAKARIKKEITLHSFRHTFATHLIQRGMPIRHVQELMGHKELESTTRYLNLTIKDLQKEYKKTHPRELVG